MNTKPSLAALLLAAMTLASGTSCRADGLSLVDLAAAGSGGVVLGATLGLRLGSMLATPVKQRPPQLRLTLQVGATTYVEPNDKTLASLYGPDYRTSAFYRTRLALAAGTPVRQTVERFVQLRGQDLTIAVAYDRPDRLIPGTTYQEFDPAKKKWKSCTVKAGDTVASVAAALGLSTERFLQNHPESFNVWPHAHWELGTAQLSETWRGLSDQQLAGLIVHESSHLADGSARYGVYLGPDGMHGADEVTFPATAWIEGFAEYTQARFDPAVADKLADSMLCVQMPFSSRTKPCREALLSPSFDAHVANEACVAAVLAELDANGACREDVLGTVAAGNARTKDESLKDRTILTFCREYLAAHPAQADRVLLALDSSTEFTAPAEELCSVGGEAARSYVASRALLAGAYREARVRSMLDRTPWSRLQFFAALDPGKAPLDAATVARVCRDRGWNREPRYLGPPATEAATVPSMAGLELQGPSSALAVE